MCTKHNLYWQVIRYIDSLREPVLPDKMPFHVINDDGYACLKDNK